MKLKIENEKHVRTISVFYGISQQSVLIVTSDTIKKIIRSLQTIEIRRGKKSTYCSNNRIDLCFYDVNENLMQNLIINHTGSIYDDDYEYTPVAKEGLYDYFKSFGCHELFV